MASARPTRILLANTDMSTETIAALSDAEAWRLIYALDGTHPKDTRLQICFTGFRASKKQQLVDLANKGNLRVVSSVTRGLSFLCCGDNASAMKLAKAAAQGVLILTDLQFLRLLETGEITDSR